MDRRTYVLLTGVSLALVAALLGTPLWDHWYYSGLQSSPGATMPVAAVVASPRPSPAPSRAGMWSPSPPAGTPEPAWSPAPTNSASKRSAVDSGTTTRAAGHPVSPLGPATERRAVVPRPEPAAPAPESSAAEAHPTSPAGTDRSAGGSGVFYAQPAPALTPPQRDRQAEARPPDPARGGSSSSRIQPVPAAPGEPNPSPAGAPVVTLIPEPIESWPGGMIVVTVHVSDADSMSSLPFHLRFDPQILEYVGSEAGPELAASHEAVLLASVNPNRPGDLAVGLSLVESSGLFTGSGALVLLQFRAVAEGESDLEFDRATLRGATSQPLDARFEKTRITVR